MKGTNDAWNICIKQCIVKCWLFRAKLVKVDNSESYKLINSELRDVVYPKPQSVF